MGRNRNFCRGAIALALLSLLGLPITGAGAMEHPVPFEQVTTRDFFGGDQEIQSGWASHFGAVTLTFTGTFFDPTTLAFAGTVTYVTASGDLANGTFAGRFTGATSGLYGEGSIAFSGGTGRFQDLTGNVTFKTYADATTGVVTTIAEGTISY